MALINKNHPMKTRTPFKTRLADGFARLWAALKSHPVELLILLHAAASAFLKGNPWWQQPSSYAAFAVTAAFCLSRFRGPASGPTNKWAGWGYWAVIPLYALTTFFPEAWPKSFEFAILDTLMPAAYLLTLPARKDDHFAERFYRLLRSAFIALGIATILFILLSLINLTLDTLFKFKAASSLWGYFSSICYIVLAPMLFISTESQEEQPKVIRLVEVIVNYVFTPVLLVYNLILYVYLVTILVNWDLPKGSVSTMVMVFTIVAIAIRLVRPLLAKQPLKWYFRWFALFALPLVALFWVAVGYRIGQYGITVDRCILFVSGALMTLYLVGSIFFSTSRFNYAFTAILVLCGVVLAVGGPLSARQIALHSQTAIVREKAQALGILTPEGMLDTTKELFFRTEADSSYRKEHRIAYQAMKYIENDLADTVEVRASLGMTSADYLDRLSVATSNYATAWWIESDGYSDDVEEPIAYSFSLSCNKEETLDISGYNRMGVGMDVKVPVRYIPYPGGRIPADTLLATQLAKIGYTLSSNLDRKKLDDNECTLCHYQSPDGKVLILFDYMYIQRTDSLNHITSATIRCALVR